MREIFSVRFFAAVGVVVGLFFLLTVIFAAGEAIDGGGDGGGGSGADVRRIDLIDQIFSVSGPPLQLSPDGFVAADTSFILDERRSVRIVTDTPGVDHCPALGELGACAIVADLLGDGVVWFAVVPMGEDRSVDLPAIDVLDDGSARLVNGWEVPYAPILERRCEDDQGNDVEFASYREFRDVLGDDFTSVYSLESGRLEVVICGERVAYAPEPATVTTSTSPSSLP